MPVEVLEAELERQRVLVDISVSNAMRAGNTFAISKSVTAAGARCLGVERVSVWFLEGHDSRLVCKDLFTLSTETHEDGVVLEASKYPEYFKAVENNRVVAASDARNDPSTREFREGYLEPLGITSMLDVSVVVGGKIVGVVCAEHIGDKREWLDWEVAFMAELGELVSSCCSNFDLLEVKADLEALNKRLEERLLEHSRDLRVTNKTLQHEVRLRNAMRDDWVTSGEQIMKLLDTADNIICQVGVDGIIVFANQNWRDAMGYSLDELKEMKLVDVVSSEYSDHCQAMLADLKVDSALQPVEIGFKCKDGSEKTLRGTVGPCYVIGSKRTLSAVGVFRADG